MFDLLRNEVVGRLQHAYQTSNTTLTEHISHVLVTSSDQYVVAALQRASDDMAVFIVFDLTVNSHSAKTICLHASAEVVQSLHHACLHYD